MCEQTGYTSVLNDHDIGFSENAKNSITNLIQSHNPLLIHNMNPSTQHAQDPLTVYDPVSSGPTAPSFMTERLRRMQLCAMYAALRDLIPNPTETDRASVVKAAIKYIKELTRTVQDLKSLVERKRHRSHDRVIRIKKQKLISTMNGSNDTKPLAEFSEQDDHDHDHDSSSRSSWLERKSKDTEVYVRIIDDEVAVKLVQRKKINILLSASKLLDQLHLDIRHVASGCVGDSYTILFKTMICQGSSLCASAIANKLIEVLDIHYAAISRL